MVNPASRPNDVGQFVGVAREVERVCLDDNADVVIVSDALLGSLPHGAPCTGLNKLPHVLEGFDILPHTDIPCVAAKHDVPSRALKLRVFIQGACVGDLRDDGGVWSFCYARKWARNANHCALAAGIPLQKKSIVDSGTIRPVQRYFESLLPDYRARISHAEFAQMDSVDSFSLLAHWGAKSAGYHLGDYPDFIQFCQTPNKLT
jgi:HipA-like protein